jgi:hypothetical protein
LVLVAEALGISLASALLLALVAGIWWVWRRPMVGLGLIVGGMAFHSLLLMVLLRLGTPHLLIRVFQGWKELLLGVLTLIALAGIWRERREGKLGRLLLTDWLAIVFAVLVVIYFVLPSSILHSSANLPQRLVGFRIDALIPLLYFLGRRLPSEAGERFTAAWLCLGAGAAVAVFGIVELWFIPTSVWLDWGVNLYTGFLGYTYKGPGGLPENFFLTLADGTLVRRMVSTYISPLGIAYTALLVLPLGAALIERKAASRLARWLAAIAFGLLLVGLMLSVTRMALLLAVAEAGLLVILLRRWWIAVLVPALAVAAAFMLYAYPSLGPAVDRNLNVGRGGHGQGAISANDSSANEHYTYLFYDVKVDFQHPFGLGTGSSTIRYGQLVGTGESAVLGMFGDLGLIGGLVYSLLYVLVLWQSFYAFRRLPRGSLEVSLPLVALVGGLALLPVTMTSDVWGDLSVTFLFWWAAGAGVTLAHRALGASATLPTPSGGQRATRQVA